MPKQEAHRENGPATRGAAHGSAAAGSGRLVGRKRRTGEEAAAPPNILRFLEVFAGLRRPVSRAIARCANSLGLRTAFQRNVKMRGLAKECRASAARESWRFQRVVVRTYQDAQRRCCGTLKRADSRAGCRDCCRCEMSSGSVCPRRCSSPRAAARTSNRTNAASAVRSRRSPKERIRWAKGVRCSGRTHERLRTECCHHRTTVLGYEKRGKPVDGTAP